MSIEICSKCSKSVDTDFNAEEINYVNHTAFCNDCLSFEEIDILIQSLDLMVEDIYDQLLEESDDNRQMCFHNKINLIEKVRKKFNEK